MGASEYQSLLKQLGVRVKLLRQEMGLSQEELAYQADIDRTYISQIERGVCNPSLLILFSVARALNTSVIKLFEKTK
jgi:transcriptional regulator with XRE-family HTH domain